MKPFTKKQILNEREKLARTKFKGIMRAVTHPGPCVLAVNGTFVGLCPMQIAG